jgi:hypothetical protein
VQNRLNWRRPDRPDNISISHLLLGDLPSMLHIDAVSGSRCLSESNLGEFAAGILLDGLHRAMWSPLLLMPMTFQYQILCSYSGAFQNALVVLSILNRSLSETHCTRGLMGPTFVLPYHKQTNFVDFSPQANYTD